MQLELTNRSHEMFEQTKQDTANFSYIWYMYNLTLLFFTWE